MGYYEDDFVKYFARSYEKKPPLINRGMSSKCKWGLESIDFLNNERPLFKSFHNQRHPQALYKENEWKTDSMLGCRF